MISWVLSSSVLILGILLLRRGLKGKISLRLQYALWLVVLVRLLCPLNFFESSLSVQNAVNTIQDRTAVQTTVEETSQLPADEGQVWEDVQTPVQEQADLPEAEPSRQVQEQTFASEPAAPKINWERAAMTVWLVGALVMLSFTLGCNFQFARMLSRNRDQIQVSGVSVPVYVSSWVKTPCLVGILRPVIYLTPEVAADQGTWNHVIRHELTHLEHFDHGFSLLRCVALCLHWYNPLVWLAARISKEDAELACDEGTIARLGEQERIGYGETLIRLTCRSKSAADLMLTATTMVGTQGGIRERIRCLAKKPKTLAYALVISLVVVGLMIGCTFSSPVEAEEWTEPEETIPVETIPEETEAEETLPAGTIPPDDDTVPTETEPLERFIVDLPGEEYTNSSEQMLMVKNYLWGEWSQSHPAENRGGAQYVITGFISPEESQEATAQTSVYLYQIDFEICQDGQTEYHTAYALFWKNDRSTLEKYYGYNAWEEIGFLEPEDLEYFARPEYIAAYGNKYAAAVMTGAELFGEADQEGKAKMTSLMERLNEEDGNVWCSEIPEVTVPMQESNRTAILNGAVGNYSWVALDLDPSALDCDYVEFTAKNGDWIRFYNYGCGIAEVSLNGERSCYGASPLVRYNATEGRICYYYAFAFYYGSYLAAGYQ